MALFGCDSKRDCLGLAVIISVIIGIVTAFLRITAVVIVPPVFLWTVFGIAIVYLAVLLATSSFSQGYTSCNGRCSTLSAILLGNLGTILLSVVLLAISFAATSIIGAILTGALLLFFSLMITATACAVRCQANCNN